MVIIQKKPMPDKHKEAWKEILIIRFLEKNKSKKNT